jgi:cobalt/nickel transport system permease protein
VRRFVLAGLVVAFLLAGVASAFASAAPDGLEKVAADQGFAAGAEQHALAGSPVADYRVDGVEDERVGTGLAGVLGVAVTFAVGTGFLLLVRRRSTSTG